jgi:methylmalonyl-CoA mutase N-terminal domain/subunit
VTSSAILESLRDRKPAPLARAGDLVKRRLDALSDAARRQDNVIPPMLDAARAYATLFEICEALERVYGSYREPIFF